MIAALLGFIARVLSPLLPLLTAWGAGKRDQALVDESNDLAGYKATRERMDNAREDKKDADTAALARAARERMRERLRDQR